MNVLQAISDIAQKDWERLNNKFALRVVLIAMNDIHFAILMRDEWKEYAGMN